MGEPGDDKPREGDEIWFGLIGPIQVSNATTADDAAWSQATRIAQAAHTLADLAALVASHPDWRVRYAAVPRLRARFPDEALTLQTLAGASRDPQPGVRDAATVALGDLAVPAAADLIYDRLTDENFDVRLSAAMSLQTLDDPRAPADAEAWALEGMLDPPHPNASQDS